MKNTVCLLVLSLLLSFTSAINAQNNETIAVVEHTPIIEKTNKPKKKKSRIPFYYRHHRQMPSTFTGYTIELATSKIPLKRDDELFKYFGKVYYTKLKKGGFAYNIMVNFSTKSAVRNFLENIVIHKAPDARIVEYKKGKRK